MSDEKLRHTAFASESEELDASADTEREPTPAPASTPRRGAALSVLWWETDEPRDVKAKP